MRGRGGGGGGGFGRRPYNQPQMPDVPDKFEHVVYPPRRWNFHAHNLNKEANQPMTTIPSIDPARAQHQKPAAAKLFAKTPCTIFSTIVTGEESSPNDKTAASNDTERKIVTNAGERMTCFNTNYFYAKKPSGAGAKFLAPNPGSFAVSTPTTAGSPKRGAATPTTKQAKATFMVSSIMTTETDEKVASNLPPELLIDVEHPNTWKIKNVKRKRVEKPLRRGGVVTAAPVVTKRPGAKPSAGSKRGRDGLEVGGGSGSDDDEDAHSAGDTDEMSSIAGEDDDEDDGSDNELTM